VLIDIDVGASRDTAPANAAAFFLTRNEGVAMQYRKELLPLAVMGSLSAAIMVVFAVTVMH
jgi:hypothetical protein